MDPNDRIAILGWGSLIWDPRPDFDRWHREWKPDGPELPIEFSRVSESRDGALTLVIDAEHGSSIQVAWCLSKRRRLVDAVGDLRCREGTTDSNIGRVSVPVGQDDAELESIEGRIIAWARENEVSSVVWTTLATNFMQKTRNPFSVARAIAHLQGLDSRGKAKAAEYVWRAPSFVQTPLRDALEVGPWFSEDADPNGADLNGI